MGSQHFALLTLPPELRLLIYSFMLPSPMQLTVYSFHHKHLFQQLSEQNMATTAFCGAVEDKGTPSQRHPAILATCRQIYREAKPSLYSPNTLKLIPGSDGNTRGLGLARFNTRNLRSLPPLQKLIVTITELTQSMYQDSAHSRFLTKNACLGLETKDLEINILRHKIHPADSPYWALLTDHLLDLASLWLRVICAQRSTIVLNSNRWGTVIWEKKGAEEWKDIGLGNYAAQRLGQQGEREELFALFKAMCMSLETPVEPESKGCCQTQYELVRKSVV